MVFQTAKEEKESEKKKHEQTHKSLSGKPKK